MLRAYLIGYLIFHGVMYFERHFSTVAWVMSDSSPGFLDLNSPLTLALSLWSAAMYLVSMIALFLLFRKRLFRFSLILSLGTFIFMTLITPYYNYKTMGMAEILYSPTPFQYVLYLIFAIAAFVVVIMYPEKLAPNKFRHADAVTGARC